MARENVKKFYEMMRTDEHLKEELAKLKEELEKSDKKFLDDEYVIEKKIIPLAKKYGLEFTASEFVSYTKEKMTELSEEDLLNISGGVGILSFVGLGLLGLAAWFCGGEQATPVVSDVPTQAQVRLKDEKIGGQGEVDEAEKDSILVKELANEEQDLAKTSEGLVRENNYQVRQNDKMQAQADQQQDLAKRNEELVEENSYLALQNAEMQARIDQLQANLERAAVEKLSQGMDSIHPGGLANKQLTLEKTKEKLVEENDYLKLRNTYLEGRIKFYEDFDGDLLDQVDLLEENISKLEAVGKRLNNAEILNQISLLKGNISNIDALFEEE